MICITSTNLIVFISGMITSLVLGVGVTVAVLTMVGNRVNGLEEDLERFETEMEHKFINN